MAIKTYDPKSVAIIFGGIIITGWNSVSVEYEEDSYEHSVGADGEEMRTKKNDNRASMTVFNPSGHQNGIVVTNTATTITGGTGTTNVVYDDNGLTIICNNPGNAGNLHVRGVANVDQNLNVAGNAAVGQNLNVAGSAAVGQNLTVQGQTTLNGPVTVNNSFVVNQWAPAISAGNIVGN
jgi:hypothetical protein